MIEEVGGPERLDLSGKDLSGIDLGVKTIWVKREEWEGEEDPPWWEDTGLNLQWANLSGANLQRADLTYSKLQGAYLEEAKLQGANLRDANLEGVKYSDATIWPEGFTPPPEAVKVEE